jgi:hypothetical protein
MKRLLVLMATLVGLVLVPASQAVASVEQVHDTVRHDVFTVHDSNICGNEGTFTFDVSSHTHVVDMGDGRFAFNFTQVYTYTLVFDDPTLGTWTARTTETIVHVSNASGDIIHDNQSAREGPVQIIVHQQLRFETDGTVTVDREFERIVGC